MGWKQYVGIGGVLAVVIAGVSVFVFDCHYNEKEDDCPEDWPNPDLLTPVLVATQDLPAGRSMDSAIKDGHVSEVVVPTETFDERWVTEVAQIEGKSITMPIRSNEMIPLDSLRWTIPPGSKPGS